MSGKKAKAARGAVRVQESRKRRQSRWYSGSWKGWAIALGVVAIIAASFVVPKLGHNGSSSQASVVGHAGMNTNSDRGKGLEAGASVPVFSEQNVETGQTISSASLYRHKTLLFFSEGVMCQACFEQIKGLEQMGSRLSRRGIQLISITPDSPRELRQAIGQFGIRSPMISDENRDMSAAFNTLGLGMHGDMPGHAFALIDRGTVRWYHDYWLPPDQTMYVDPGKVIADIAAA